MGILKTNEYLCEKKAIQYTMAIKRKNNGRNTAVILSIRFAVSFKLLSFCMDLFSSVAQLCLIKRCPFLSRIVSFGHDDVFSLISPISKDDALLLSIGKSGKWLNANEN